LKSKINLLGKQLKQRPFDRAVRNDYFITATTKNLKRLQSRRNISLSKILLKSFYMQVQTTLNSYGSY
jgi:hypothetical protein